MKSKLFHVEIMILVIIGLGSVCSLLNQPVRSSIYAKNEYIDLSKYDFNQKGCVILDGHWKSILNDRLRQTKGYKTLCLKINVKEDGSYGIRIGKMTNSYDVWINDVHQERQSIHLPMYAYFPSKDKAIHIMIRLSNHEDMQSVGSIQMGLKNQMMNKEMLLVSVEAIVFGALSITGLFFFCVYYFRRKEKRYVYFALLCVLTQLRYLILNEKLFIQMVPMTFYDWISKINFITYYLWIWIYILFLKEQCKNLPKKFIWVVMCFLGLFTVVSVWIPYQYCSRLHIYKYVMTTLIGIGVFVLLVKKYLEDKKNIYSLLSFIILGCVAIHDVLLKNYKIYGEYQFQIGMFIFVCIACYELAKCYSEKSNELENLSKENEQHYENSIKDFLTNVYNRRYIRKNLKEAMEQYKILGTPFTLLMIDIDHFKEINDRYGHPFGDQVIKGVCSILKKHQRPSDVIGRYGGEEFLIILHGSIQSEGVCMAKRIQKGMDTLIDKNYNIQVTVSIGVYENRCYTKEECIQKVDDLLYQAKRKGRNRIEYDGILLNKDNV